MAGLSGSPCNGVQGERKNGMAVGGIRRPLKRAWSGRAESNCRLPGPKPGALPLGHAPHTASQVGRLDGRDFGKAPRYCRRGRMVWYPRRGSNSHLWLRRPALYPLSYGDPLKLPLKALYHAAHPFGKRLAETSFFPFRWRRIPPPIQQQVQDERTNIRNPSRLPRNPLPEQPPPPTKPTSKILYILLIHV